MDRIEGTPHNHWHEHLADLVRQVPIFVVASLLLAVCIALLVRQGIALSPAMVLGSAEFYLQSILMMMILDSVWIMARHRPRRLSAHLWERYGNAGLRARLLARLPLFIVLVGFMPIFSQMKSMIPLLHPYDWDTTLMGWDRAIFGMDAWRFLQPALGHPIITSALSMAYHGWILLVFPGTLYILLCEPANAIRNRYFLCFVLIWTVVGIAMATSLASVGPCFAEPILGNPRFAAQMAYLRSANEQYPVLVLHVQDLLLGWYRAQDHGLGRGITAMPSMHVAMAFLYFLTVRHVSRAAGWVALIFFAIIWLASVHLAYHYAVDGLVSIIATTILWFASKSLLDWWESTAPALIAAMRLRAGAVAG